jgi:hypothetical protein
VPPAKSFALLTLAPKWKNKSKVWTLSSYY